ncbi:MAG: ThuA domain-containing protein [Actinobacteria bacterium]|nr:ThuA domain-containing protein [Actinomycetota bacterium]
MKRTALGSSPLLLLALAASAAPHVGHDPSPGGADVRASTSGAPSPLSDADATVEILWVETNGAFGGFYSSSGLYAPTVAHLDLLGNVTVLDSGVITQSLLDAYDVVVVSSVANYDFPWTTTEIDAFEAYVRGGGGLFVWTDNSGVSHVAVDPLLERFGIARGLLDSGNDWTVTAPPLAGTPLSTVLGGTLVGGDAIWVLNPAGRPTGVLAAPGAGIVAALADGNAFAQSLTVGANELVLDVVVWALAR